jgi:hypothetical protein
VYNEILDAVRKKLGDLFPETKVSADPLEEGETAPYFRVRITEAEEKLLNGSRYLRNISISIMYYSEESQDAFRERNNVLNVLMDNLEYITFADGSSIRGSMRTAKNEEKYMDFFTEYQTYVLKSSKSEDSMEDIKLS